ncbi:PREDICTED: uncharacterized protein LOC108556655 isoform X2 [Nicrophorus vespilloides]|uniref:Uncharacterized protein LOC108556655 isoform X2 n=1 Tax=Nicrophorus vespilloides TaxID=110193 RepID=A0ABM1M191_NICVS|nr:PREDICTED: uncharacterized protein LOC108556655 isoform X2 [Nicrophorus vespilloides]
MKFLAFLLIALTTGVALATTVVAKDCHKGGSGPKLFCYYGHVPTEDEVIRDACRCSHLVLPHDSDAAAVDSIRSKLESTTKILITVHDLNEGLVKTLKKTKVDGLEVKLKKLRSREDIADFLSTVRTKLDKDLFVALSVPAKPEILAKYYDFKALSKSADVFLLETSFLGTSKNVTFHPSRLSGLWDVQNTDSVVDLVSGLGAPLSKLVVAAPVQAFKFALQAERHTAPGSPALELSTISRDELCDAMGAGEGWTLERDQDQAGPYIFREKEWIAFEDSMSMDIKAKYARVRGLAGLALKDVSQDGGSSCGGSLLAAAAEGLSRQARAPRGALLHSLEREILETPAKKSKNVQLSPYRISRVIDVEGKVHVIRQDTRTEFECSRQGYFVHPRSCGRFYRCVKFDQLTEEFSVFEFDCPAGLAFDERVEVCVWPGSLPHASACSGSSEIAPVPKQRFVCPSEPGYYADPENCRWFFACLDHGTSPLTAYEFRCPYGLVFDGERLLCEWPWLVPKCASGLAFAEGYESRTVGDYSLDLYDGLGSLNGIRLGGLSGPLQQPISKTYSSFSKDNYQNLLLGIGNSNVDHSANLGLLSGGNLHAAVNEHSNGAGSKSGSYSRFSTSGSRNSAGNYNKFLSGNAQSTAGAVHESGLNAASGKYNKFSSGSSSNSGNQGFAHGDGLNIASGLVHETGSNSAAGNYNKYSSGSSSISGSQGFAHGEALNIASGENGNYNKFSSGSSSISGNSGSEVSGGFSTGIVHGEGIVHEVGSNTGNYKKFSSISANAGASHGHRLNVASGNAKNYNAFSSGSANAGSRVSGGFSSGIVHKHGSNLASGNAETYSKFSIGSGSVSGNSGSHVLKFASGVEHGEGLNIAAGNAHNYNTYSSGSNIISGNSEIAAGFSSGVAHGEGVNVASENTESNSKFSSANSGSQVSGGYSTGIVHGEGLNLASHGEELNVANGNAYNSFESEANSNYGGFSAEVAHGEGLNLVAGNAESYSKFSSGSDSHSGNSQSHVSGGYSSGVIHGEGLNVAAGNVESYNKLSSGAHTISGNSGIVHGEGLILENAGISSEVVHGEGLNVAAGNAESYSKFSSGSSSIAGNAGTYVTEGYPSGIDHGENLKLATGLLLGEDEGLNVATESNYNKFSLGSSLLSESQVTEGGFSSGIAHGLNLGSGNDESYSKFSSGSSSSIYGNSGSQIAEGFSTGVAHGDGLIDHTEYGNQAQTILLNQESINAGSHEYSQNTGFATGVVGGQEESTLNLASVQSSGFSSGIVHGQSSSSQAEAVNLAFGSRVTSGNSQGHIDIVGGGFSGVGNVKVLENAPVVASVVTSIPTVTAVPIPAQKEFETYNAGGVVANLPDLQLKLEHPSTINHHLTAKTPAVTVTDVLFASTPSSLGYDYPKPKIPFIEGSTAKPTYLPPVQKTYLPSVQKTYVPSVQKSYVRPLRPVGGLKATVIENYNKPAVVTTYHHQRPAVVQQHVKIHESKPAIAVQEVKVVKPAVVQTYYHQKPAVIEQQTVHVQPTVTYESVKIEKPVNFEGYKYEKPTIVFEEKPQIKIEKPAVVQTYFHQKPAVIEHQTVHIQPTVTYESVRTEKPVKFEGYRYEKPTVAFEEKRVQKVKIEKPAVVQTYFHQKPAVIRQQTVHVQPTVTYEKPAVIEQQTVEVKTPVKFEGYQYEKPTIKFEIPKPKVTYQQEVKVQKPAVVQTYYHQKPAVVHHKIVQEVQPQIEIKQQTVEVNQGYHYEKPTIKFEERSKPVVSYQQEVKVQKPAVVESYYHQKPAVVHQQIVHEVQPKVEIKQQAAIEVNQGYHYEKPTIKFEERPKPVVTYHKEVRVQKPAVVQTYYHQKPAVVHQQIVHEVQPQVEIKQQTVKVDEGYHYEKPTIKFEETPKPVVTYQQEIKVQKPAVVHSYYHQKPAVIQQQTVKPIVSYEQVKPEIKFEGYHYEKPAVKFEIPKPTVTYHQEVKVKKPAVVVESYYQQKPVVIQHQTERPTVVYEKPAITGYQEVKIEKPVESYHYQKPAVVKIEEQVQFQGYKYEKPTIAFEEKRKEVKIEQPAVVQTYFHQKHVTPNVAYEKPVVVEQKTVEINKFEGYHYEKPSIQFEEKPQQVVSYQQEVKVQKPAFVHSYYNQKPAVTYESVKVKQPVVHRVQHRQRVQVKNQEGYRYEKPAIVFEEKPQVIVEQQKPAVVETYFHQKQPVVLEQKTIVQVNPVTAKPVVVENYVYKDEGYHYEKPAIAFEERPTYKEVVTQTVRPTTPRIIPQVSTYTYHHRRPTYVSSTTTERVPVVEEIIIPKKAYVTGSEEGYSYPKPEIKFELPKPTLVAEIENAPLKEFRYYDSRYQNVVSSTAAPLSSSTYRIRTRRPTLKRVYLPVSTTERVVALTREYLPVTQEYIPITTAKISKEYLPVTRRPSKQYLPVTKTYVPVTRRPSKEYLPVTTAKINREYLPVTRRPSKQYLPVTEINKEYLPVTTARRPSKEYLPVTTEPSKEYLPVTTARRPSKEYLPVSTARRPSKEYLPVTTPKQYVSVTTPREYVSVTTEVPFVSTAKISKEYLPATTSRRPSKEYLPVTRKPSREYLPVAVTTLIPSKEYLPVKGIQVENYENKEYQISLTEKPSREYLPVKSSTRRPQKSKAIIKVNDFHPILAAKLGAQCTCVSNTLKLRKRPTTRIQDLEEYVEQAQEDGDDNEEDEIVIVRKSTTPSSSRVGKKSRRPSVTIVKDEEEDESASIKEEIKSAVREGVKAGVKEALASKDFDRYGPGGLRGRTETLQGTVDCQRAGLFRHPKHCNKFYTCRWDESKKKFTLHVFNCPVHLTFDNNLGACNWPSQGPACVDNTLLPSE